MSLKKTAYAKLVYKINKPKSTIIAITIKKCNSYVYFTVRFTIINVR